jgi:methionine sulfoxide reductase heme-binding subunit
MKKFWLSGWTKALLCALCLVPFLNLLWRGYQNELTANPIEFITHYTGDWTVRFLLITLAITPLRAILNQPQLFRFRRMIGLFAFFYVCLHFATWIWLDKDFDTHEMWEDVIKRRFITAGMTGILLLMPLAVTSTAGWVRRLGYRRWQLLHRLIYPGAIAGVVHYYWGVKSDIRMPLMYGGILAALLFYRLAALRITARKSARATRPLRPPVDAPG